MSFLNQGLKLGPLAFSLHSFKTQRRIRIPRSGNYEELGHELSSNGLLGSFGWTRVNLKMAAKESTCEESVRQIVLTEEDIPGAKLPRGNAEECTFSQLRRWLL